MIVGLVFGLILAQADPQSTAHAAVDDFRAGKYADARDEFRKALQYAPKNPALWAYLGLTEGNLNDVPHAIADLEKARSLEPRDPQVVFDLAALYARADNLQRAREMYREGLTLQPEDPAANQNYALLLMQAGQYNQALVPLRKLRLLQPDQISVRVSLIECNLKAGFVQEAEREFASFLQLPELTLENRVKTARALVEDHLSEAAETVLKDTVQRYEQSPEAHAVLGKLLLDRRQYEEATIQLGRAVQLAPDTPGYSLTLAQALLEWKHFVPALQFLRAVQPKFGTLPDFRYELGLALYGSNLYPQAITEFEAVTRDHSNADAAWFFQGNCWAGTGKLGQAEMCYRKAIALNSRNPSYYTALGKVLMQGDQDRTSEAIDTFSSALKLEPANAESLTELALCYERRRQLDAAKPLLEQVIKAHPDFTQAHVALARVYYRLHRTVEGDREKAIAAQLERQQQSQEVNPTKQKP